MNDHNLDLYYQPERMHSVLDLIRETIKSTPEHTAILSSSGTLTYRDFGKRVGNLASRLRTQGIGSGRRVGVFASPSEDGIVGIVGAAMTGAAYVPLCPSLPHVRLRGIAEDSAVALVLRAKNVGDSIGLDRITFPITECADIDTTPKDMLPVVYPDSPISVIYTSGSTGRPKGVINTHRGLLNRVLWGQRAYPLRAEDRVLQHTRYLYDFSAWEIFATLAFGATLVVPECANYPDFRELAEAIEQYNITTVHFVPSVLSGVIDREAFRRCGALSTVFSGGESLSRDIARRFRSRSAAALFNQYGPTETSIDSTFYTYVSDDPREDSVPIGTAIDQTQLFILDEGLNPVRTGDAGELYIAGAGLALGYTGRPGLTAERFIPNPFDSSGSRMYRTGDRVASRVDGNLEFRGRLDLQVNLRGVRIELEEVESVLELTPNIDRAVAIVADGESPSLIAMVFPVGDSVVDTAQIREAAKQRLPAAFVPDQIFQGRDLPVLPNGKIDRARVRELAMDARRRNLDRTERPSSVGGSIHSFVAEIWKEHLGLDTVTSEQNFFDLGGHSLLAVEMVSVVGERLGIEVPLADFFEVPTLETVIRLVTLAEVELPITARHSEESSTDRLINATELFAQ